MTAAKLTRAELGDQARAGVYGHVPGVAVGDVFDGRGALAVLGLHAQVGFRRGCYNKRVRMINSLFAGWSLFIAPLGFRIAG
jgi:hypothetical protein